MECLIKKLAAILVGLATAAVMNLSLPAAAEARANDNVDYCRYFVSLTLFESHGECMGTFRSQAPRICRELRDLGALDFFGWRNIGQCVSSLREYD